MKIVGLITEYNPFHNGHLYHIKEALAKSGADAAIVCMSGDFVQRGEPAVLSKFYRAQMAIEQGASAVFELPVCFSTGSAEYFASYAVKMLNAMGCVDFLCFGSESYDLVILDRIAEILIHEPEEYQRLLKEQLKSGLSYPKARSNALSFYLDDPSLAELLSQPNNILGIEYLKALKRTRSTIKPLTIRRIGNDYHEATLNREAFSSATSIRSALLGADFPQLTMAMPASCERLLSSLYHKEFPIQLSDLSLILKYKLLQVDSTILMQYQDVTEELANRILHNLNQYENLPQFLSLLHTKELTYSRICRALLHIVLDIKKEDVSYYLSADTVPYLRLLGFQKKDRAILTSIKQSGLAPILSKQSQIQSLTDEARILLSYDIKASELYRSLVMDRYHRTIPTEFARQLLVR